MEARLKVDLKEIGWRDERQRNGIESRSYEVIYTGFTTSIIETSSEREIGVRVK